ncbi:TetR/AcrR family transcriptional regulator [Dongia deserti]|uniref:TetR/AcrR family transcriptional regulator n=1 Tax=Dongia deserti TaxID=2268030 RepID=UPI000E655179|nr:TetR/AcrR family transcriptional regulator [Dongia deserti]
MARQDARERILEAAYDLFAHQGTRSVGVDAIIEKSGVAKMTLYRHFKSKQDLVLAFLERREALWTEDWLIREVSTRTSDPKERLLAIFDAYHDWFQIDDFEGCAFINVLLEYPAHNPLHGAAAGHLAKVRAYIGDLAVRAGIGNVPEFCDVWHMLMTGCTIAAAEGNRAAALEAKRAAQRILDHWSE